MGHKIRESYKAASDAFLSEANIDTGDDVVTKESAIAEGARNPKLPELASSERVREIADRYNQGRDGRESIDANGIAIPPEESANDCVYVYIDGVLVKQQKECRAQGSKRSSKFLENTVACIQYGGRTYNITDTDMREVFRRIMTVLVACRCAKMLFPSLVKLRLYVTSLENELGVVFIRRAVPCVDECGRRDAPVIVLGAHPLQIVGA